MTSLPGSSLRSLPPDESNGEEGFSSKRKLLSQSLSRSNYGSTDPDIRESSSSPRLVSPIIGDDEVVSLSQSSGSYERRRAQTAAGALQGEGPGEHLHLQSGEEDWYHVANPLKRKVHLTRYV